MRRSEKFLEIQAAMLKARPAFEPLKKTKENKHFGSKYADLEGAIDASIKALTDNGLLLIQSPGMYDETNRSITLTSFLSHTSGEWFEDDFQMPVPKADPQGVGTAISYARRYAQLAMFNLAAEDDDGNHASGTTDKPEIRKPQALRPTDTTIAPQKTTRVFDALQLTPPHDQDMPEIMGFAGALSNSSSVPPQFDYSGKHPLPEDPADNPPPIPKAKGEYISDGQRKRMWAIAKDRGMEKSAVKNIYGRYGAEDDFHIPWKCYKDIMAQIDVPHA